MAGSTREPMTRKPLKKICRNCEYDKGARTDTSLYQEVDQDGDRSQHVDEVAWLKKHLPAYNSLYGQNYDSSYLFYPFTDPIGQAKSGLVTLSKAEITSSKRYSLPIETNFNKFFDLDRAFTVSRIPVKGIMS